MGLISRQAAIDALKKQQAYFSKEDSPLVYYEYRRAIEAIEWLPSVEAVEVVRCHECKWFQCNMRMDGYLPKGVDEFECRHWCGSCDPVDFCSRGERKEE